MRNHDADNPDVDELKVMVGEALVSARRQVRDLEASQKKKSLNVIEATNGT